MPLPLVLRKMISPVEVKLVLSAFSEETKLKALMMVNRRRSRRLLPVLGD